MKEKKERKKAKKEERKRKRKRKRDEGGREERKAEEGRGGKRKRKKTCSPDSGFHFHSCIYKRSVCLRFAELAGSCRSTKEQSITPPPFPILLAKMNRRTAYEVGTQNLVSTALRKIFAVEPRRHLFLLADLITNFKQGIFIMYTLRGFLRAVTPP